MPSGSLPRILGGREGSLLPTFSVGYIISVKGSDMLSPMPVKGFKNTLEKTFTWIVLAQ